MTIGKKTKEYNVFVSEDGMEFTSASACKKWEEHLALEKEFEKIATKLTQDKAAPLDDFTDTGNREGTYYIVRPCTPEDIYLIRTWVLANDGYFASDDSSWYIKEDELVMGGTYIVAMFASCTIVYNKERLKRAMEKALAIFA